MANNDSFAVSSFVRHHPDFPYEQVKDDILGRRYRLSLVFVGKARALALNNGGKKKNDAHDVLSFPLSPREGEVVICPAVAAQKARAFNLSADGYISFLFIHGLLHLKGYDHGATMERLERHFVRKYRVV
jgi:rRNA maturation RNase YbeY